MGTKTIHLSVSQHVNRRAKDGAKGDPGTNGIGVKSANVLFAVHTSKSDSSGIADSAWKDTFSQLTLQSSYYVWSCTKTVYTEGNPTYTGKHCLGACYDFAEVTEMYVLTDSGSTIPSDGAGWSTGYTAVKGKYLWSCSRVVYTNSDIKYINKTCVGYFAKDGTNGTSFTPQGSALGHYATLAAYKAAGGNGKDDDKFLIDQSAGEGNGAPYVLGFDSSGNECYDKADVGDAYRIGTNLWVNNGSLWVDFGDIQGPKGDTGESALRVEVSPKQLVISTDENGNLVIDEDGEYYLPSDYENVDLVVYKGNANVTSKTTLTLSTPNGCNFSNENKTNLKYSSYTQGKYVISICPLGIETTKYTVGSKEKTLPKTASFVRATVTYGSETATVDIPLLVEFAAYNGGLKSDIYGLDASYTSLESKVTEQGTTLTEHTTQIAANSKQISLRASEIDKINGGLTASGIDITAHKITIDSGTVEVKNGSTTAALFENGKIKADYVDAETVVADGIKAGNIDAEGATIENLTITGAMRSPFQEVGSNMENEFSDNLSLITSSGPLNVYISDVSVKQVGRLVHLVNYRWGSNYQYSKARLTMPSGYYFFENGVQKSTIYVSRECITMLGIGDESNFFGWVILDRVDVIPNQKYGRGKKVLAYGKVTGTSTGVSIEYATFDGHDEDDGDQVMSVVKYDTGDYVVKYPSDWNIGKPFIMLTGVGYVYGASKSPAKATLIEASGTQMNVIVSDGETHRDGSFYFEISNWKDFLL